MNQAYIIVGTTENARDLALFDTLFMRTTYSFHPLRPTEMDLASAKTLHLIKNKGHNTLAPLLNQSAPFTRHAKERLELLNNLYPDKQPQPHQRIKIIH